MNLLTIASIVSAITVLITAVYKIFKLYTKVQDKYEDTMHAIKTNTLLCLKLILYSDKFSIEERLEAGEKFLEIDNDTLVKSMYEHLLDEYEAKRL